MNEEIEAAKEAIEAEIAINIKGEKAYSKARRYHEASSLKHERNGMEKALVLLDPIARKQWKP